MTNTPPFQTPNTLLVREYAGQASPLVTPVPSTPFQTPCTLLHLNTQLAQHIGLDSQALRTEHGINTLSGNTPWPDYTSIASVYCGHQFGVFVPQLGDGRALLMAELRNGTQYTQLQLKGAGPTPYSRHADGRAVLRSSIREYLASEAMHHLGISTTRALSITASQDPVYRETTETAAVVCRVSNSFLRFGHIEWLSSQNQPEALRDVLEWHIEQHHPHLPNITEWLRWVCHQTAQLIADWQSVGFCHGVMNTDNMSLLGQTIDYGPYGFMDAFDINHICNHSDHQGRYSYRNQPRIAHWNLYVLAHALQTLTGQTTEIQSILDEFTEQFHQRHTQQFLHKLGLGTEGAFTQTHHTLIENTLQFMHEHRLDFTRFFRSLSALNPHTNAHCNFALWQSSPYFPIALGNEQQIDSAKTWLEQWTNIAQQQHTQHPIAPLEQWRNTMNHTNPAFVLRNHLLHLAIEQTQHNNLHEFNRLFQALSTPYSDTLDADLIAPPPHWAKDLVLSCSS